MNYDYDKVYVNGVAFPYTPVHEAGLNDVDKDAYTSLEGRTIRNRIRHDVHTLDFNIESLSGQEMRDIMALRNPVWFDCTFFDEGSWQIVTKKMYCSSPKYTKYYLDPQDPLKNIYTNVQFGFVEE